MARCEKVKIIITCDPNDPTSMERAHHLLRADDYLSMMMRFEERMRRYRKDTDDPDIEDVWDMWFEETRELDR